MKASHRDIGHQIRVFRKKKGLSLTALSRLTGIAASNLSSIELNKTSPTLTTLLKIADAFGLKAGALLDDILYEKAVFCPGKEVPMERHGTDELFVNSLTTDVQRPQLHVRELRIQPGASAFVVPDEKTDRFFHCVRGAVGILVDTTHYQLKAGDGLYLRAWAKAECLPNSQQQCLVILTSHVPP